MILANFFRNHSLPVTQDLLNVIFVGVRGVSLGATSLEVVFSASFLNEYIITFLRLGQVSIILLKPEIQCYHRI